MRGIGGSGWERLEMLDNDQEPLGMDGNEDESEQNYHNTFEVFHDYFDKIDY